MEQAAVSSPPGRLLIPGLRRLFVVAAVLVFLAGVQLFVFAERTDRYFAWTIQPSVTAAFLGSGYWASVALELQAARERLWVEVRVVASAVFVFTVMTLVVTLVHLDRFHLVGPTVTTQAVTWLWLAIYTVVPAAMVVLVVRQLKVAGDDPPRLAPMPAPARAALAGIAAVMIGVGTALLAEPVPVAAAVWPWELTPLTGRAVGAWLAGMGLATAHAVWEDDWRRVRPLAHALVWLATFHLVTVARYADQIDWSRARAWVYVAFLTALLVLGAYAWVEVRRAYAPRPAAAGAG